MVREKIEIYENGKIIRKILPSSKDYRKLSYNEQLNFLLSIKNFRESIFLIAKNLG